MNRRELLQCAGILFSGAAVNKLAFALSPEQQDYIAGAADYSAGSVNYFTEAQRQAVSAITEIIIPRTDTPGAIDANVPRYIELMVSDWLTDEERAIFESGLAELMASSQAEHQKPFDQLPSKSQLAMLEALEAAASDSPWYNLGNIMREFVSDAPFICQIKELTVYGFFTSEAGATQVLRYNPMPMSFDGNVPLGEDESSWSGSIF